MSKQSRFDFFENGFRPGFDFLFRLVLNRMRDENDFIIGPAQSAGLGASGSHEFIRGDSHRWNA